MPALTNRFGVWLLAVTLMAGLSLAGGPYAGTAYACSCSGIPDVEEELRYSDAVFAGEMIRSGIEDPAPKDGNMMGGIEFRVDESWKGVSGDSVVVYGQDIAYYGKLEEGKMYTGNSCAYPFEKDESYLVYATRYEDGFRVEGCSGTAPLADAKGDLRVLGSSTDQLPETGGPSLSITGALAAAAALLVSAGLMLRWARS